MANLMKMKRSSVPGKVPTTADLDLGEIAINTYDGKVYMKKNVSGVETIVLLTGAGSGDVAGPASSADKAIARFSGTSGKTIQNSSATIDDSGNITSPSHIANGTGANVMPVGTTAQRPATPVTGMYRMNSTTGEPEWYNAAGGTWVKFADTANYSIEYLIVAGAGGGGAASGSLRGGGGGGAGGRISSSTTVNAGQSLAVVVGAGGASQPSLGANGNSGSNSSLGALGTAIGGGFGGGAGSGTAGGNGGSGGGGGDSTSSVAGGTGTSGQGFNGGASAGSGSNGGDGGSGGGSGGAGSSSRGSPGAGTAWVDGVTRAAGGTGGYRANGSNPGPSGAANTGNGGGGGDGTSGAGGAGGSGVVIIRYLGAQRGSGGTVSSSGGYTYHTFTSSGTFVA